MSEDLKNLIESVKAGDVIAFEKLSSRYAPLVRSETAHLMTARGGRLSVSDSEDLCQEALLALYKAVCSYKENDSMAFGLYAKICIHNCLITAARKLERYSTENSDEEYEALLSETEDPDASPEEYVLAAERMEEIHAFMNGQLTEYENRVFSMHLSHRTYAEIAEAVGRDVKSVANAIGRAKEKLKRYAF